MVERGDIEWQEDEDFEVENILAHVIEDVSSILKSLFSL